MGATRSPKHVCRVRLVATAVGVTVRRFHCRRDPWSRRRCRCWCYGPLEFAGVAPVSSREGGASVGVVRVAGEVAVGTAVTGQHRYRRS